MRYSLEGYQECVPFVHVEMAIWNENSEKNAISPRLLYKVSLLYCLLDLKWCLKLRFVWKFGFDNKERNLITFVCWQVNARFPQSLTDFFLSVNKSPQINFYIIGKKAIYT